MKTITRSAGITSVLLFIFTLPFSALFAKTQNQMIQLGDFGGRPTIELSLNASEPFSVILDTGFAGGDLILNLKKAQSIGLTKVGEKDIQNMGQGNIIRSTLWREETATIGQYSVPITRISSHHSNRKRKVGMPLGIMNFWSLTQDTLNLDLKRRQLTISDSELDPSDKSVVDISTKDTLLPSFEVTLNGKSYMAHLDTGSPSALSLPLSMKEEFEYIKKPEVVGKVRIPGYHTDRWLGQIKGALLIGEIRIENPVVSFLAPVQWVNIGSKILQDYMVTVDQKNQLIKFEYHK